MPWWRGCCLQLVNNVAPILESPPWVARTILLLLVIGFPVALVLAWMLELKAAADGTAVKTPTTRMDFVLIGALAAVIAIFVYQQLAPATNARTVAGGDRARVVPARRHLGCGAALRESFGRYAQEFFSDGMTEEIMTALAKVSALRVVGRESAFQFKGQKTDMHAVGQALGASYLVEGSVRKAGDQVRITAQLVQADNGVSLWTDTYDREMKNIFATQSDIAQAIAGALRVPLGLKQGDTLVSQPHQRFESYDQYLRAKALVRARGLEAAHRCGRSVGTGCRPRS